MQDIHSIGGGGERPFGSGDRRLRPHHNQNHQPLKCPRCDSLNTKFCYYNNYNLAQPRHFCKSCRRYWTKGGVLRNVPVGGGCRKTKRSKPKASSDAQRDRRSNSHSSSESSSLTGSTTAATTASNAATAISEVVSATTSTSASTLLNFPESRFFLPRTTNPGPHTTANPNFGPPLIDRPSDGGMFPDIGSFTNLITSSNDPSPLGFKFNMADIPSYRLHQNSHGHVVQDQGSDHQRPEQHNGTSTVADELKMQEITSGFLYQTDQIEPPELQNRTSNGGVAALDWQAGGDQALFDLTGTVDQAYWSQTQWTDNDLYLP